jgi:hypothetical protein
VIHESQFHTATDLLDIYQSLCRLDPVQGSFDTLLQSAVSHLSKQMQLSRVTCTVFGDSAQISSKTNLLLTKPNGEVTAEARDQLDIPEATLQKVVDGQPVLIPDLTSAGLNEAQARRRYLDNVASEYCMPLETSKGVVGMVACGSPVAGDYLSRTVPTLSALCGLVAVWTAIGETRSVRREVDVKSGRPCHDLTKRMDTLRRLTEVSLHGLSESVSAAIGQAELLKDARAIDDPIIEAQRQTAAADTLCSVSDKLGQHLHGLRRICALTTAPETLMNAEDELSALPEMLGDLLREFKETKNIDLRLVTEADKGLLIRSQEIYDYFVPMLMSIIEQSICSGQLKILARGSEHTVRLSVRFQQRLLGGLELPRLLTELFPQCELLLQDSGEGQMIIGDSTLIIDHDISGEYSVAMDCIRHQPPSDREGAVAISKNRKLL